MDQEWFDSFEELSEWRVPFWELTGEDDPWSVIDVVSS